MPSGYSKTPEETRKKRSDKAKGNQYALGIKQKPRSAEANRENSERMKGNQHTLGKHWNWTEEARRSWSITQKENPHNFNGGCYQYWHNLIHELYGKDATCKTCGMTYEQHRELYGTRLHAHCNLIPKDYTNTDRSSWDFYCVEHHAKEEQRLRSNNNGQAYPGDGSDPAECCNCRCSLAAHIEE